MTLIAFDSPSTTAITRSTELETSLLQDGRRSLFLLLLSWGHDFLDED